MGEGMPLADPTRLTLALDEERMRQFTQGLPTAYPLHYNARVTTKRGVNYYIRANWHRLRVPASNQALGQRQSIRMALRHSSGR